MEACWDSLGSKLSCDGTPLDDEDAGNLTTVDINRKLIFSTFFLFLSLFLSLGIDTAHKVFTTLVIEQALGHTSARRRN